MSTTGHENEVINVQGLKASLQKFKTEHVDGKAAKATTLQGYGITDAYTKNETYNKTEVNGLVSTPHQNYVTVATYASLPASGSADTIYRVSNYNGSTSQVDATMYSEYAWNGSSYTLLCVKSQIGEVFDITAYNSNTKYANLSAAIGVDGVNIPESLRKGGMSVKYVQSSDNKYVQYFLTSDSFTIVEGYWQRVDIENRLDALEDRLIDKNDIVKPAWVNGFIYWNGESTNSSYQRSNPIKMYAGDTITFTGGSDSPNVTVWALSEYNNGAYTKIIEYSTLTPTTISWTANKECNVVVSTQKTMFSGDVVVNRVGDLNKLKDLCYSTVNRISVSTNIERGYYINANIGKNASKTVTSYQNLVVTSPISLKKGDTIFVNCMPILKRPIAVFCNSNGVFGEVAINSDGTTDVKTYYLYAKEDCYVVLSFDIQKDYSIWKIANLPEHLTCDDVYMRYGENTEDTFYDYNSKQFSPGSDIWCSMTINVAKKLFIDFTTYLPSGIVSHVALFTFLDEEDNFINSVYPLDNLSITDQTYSNRLYIPIGAEKVVICHRTIYAKNTVCHIYGQKENAFVEDLRFNTMREMVSSRAKGIVSVGSMLFKNIVNSPEMKEHTQSGSPNAPYFDANESFKQYTEVGEERFIADSILDGVGKEISFVPESGFLRNIVGKGDDDTFYVTKFPSAYAGDTPGADSRVILEKTTDFVNFVSILKGYDNNVDEGLYIANIHFDSIYIVKEAADGTLIIGCKYRDDSQPSTDDSGNKNYNVYLGLLKINRERTSVNFCNGTDINGNPSRVIGSHALPASGATYVTNGMYDWHLQVCGNRIIMTEYGSRDNSHDDWGRVWYSNDCGDNWKEVFQTRHHISEGVADGSQQPSHTHGCMIDPYSNCIFVIVGEENRNIFYTDKGMDADDSDWICIPIRDQIILPQLHHTQAVNGYPFKDRIIFGSDIEGIGAFFALNRLEDGTFSGIEVAHEILPYNFGGTSYCAGAQSRRDINSPALLCFTREGQATTEAQNELLMQQHLGRVVATWDGISFFEIWHDDTYGSHTVNYDGSITTKNFCYCTRDMQAWLLHNGDLVIKYAGRNFAYLGGTAYKMAYGDFCSRCQIIKNAERFFVVK